MKYIISISIVFINLILLTSCINSKEPIAILPDDAEPEIVVETYIKYIKQNYKEGILSLLTDKRKKELALFDGPWEYKGDIKSIERLNDISYINKDDIDFYGVDNVAVVKVVLDNKNEPLMTYFLARNNSKSPWKIMDWGILGT